MNRILYFLILGTCLLTFASCEDEQPPINPKKMAHILTEVHMAEAYAQLVPVDKGGYMTKNVDTMLLLYANIYAKNGVDTASFNQAVDWYEDHPKLFDSVYSQVLASLSIRKERLKDSTIVYSDSTKMTLPDTL